MGIDFIETGVSEATFKPTIKRRFIAIERTLPWLEVCRKIGGFLCASLCVKRDPTCFAALHPCADLTIEPENLLLGDIAVELAWIFHSSLALSFPIFAVADWID